MANILSFNDFKFLIGETIGFCQTVEYDLKNIFAKVCEGDFEENFECVSRWTLGQIVTQMEEYDNELEDKHFTNLEYRILRDMTKKRNYVCHEIFRTFAYTKEFLESNEYMMACNVVIDFHEDVVAVAKKIEQLRLNLGISVYKK